MQPKIGRVFFPVFSRDWQEQDRKALMSVAFQEETVCESANNARTFTILRRADAPVAPLVSVVVPVFNASSTLEEALCSITNQTLEDIEIVCVNDASNDTSPEILQRFFAQDARFTIVNHAENAGYGAAMNDGIQTARGTWDRHPRTRRFHPACYVRAHA